MGPEKQSSPTSPDFSGLYVEFFAALIILNLSHPRFSGAPTHSVVQRAAVPAPLAAWREG